MHVQYGEHGKDRAIMREKIPRGIGGDFFLLTPAGDI